MTQHTILASFLIEADTHEEAAAKAQAFIDYGMEVINDDDAIAAAGAETPDATTVYVAAYDVHNSGSGVDVFRSRDAAIESILSCIEDQDLEGEDMTREQARASLTEDGYLNLQRREDYYRVTTETVRA